MSSTGFIKDLIFPVDFTNLRKEKGVWKAQAVAPITGNDFKDSGTYILQFKYQDATVKSKIKVNYFYWTEKDKNKSSPMITTSA